MFKISASVDFHYLKVIERDARVLCCHHVCDNLQQAMCYFTYTLYIYVCLHNIFRPAELP
jgi:hypothetical protein